MAQSLDAGCTSVAHVLDQELQHEHALSLTQASQLHPTQRSAERFKTRSAVLAIERDALLRYIEDAEPSSATAKRFALVCGPRHCRRCVVAL